MYRKISLWGSRKNINTNIEVGVSKGKVAMAQGWDWASLVAQTVKNFPAMQEIWVQYLGWEDPLEKGMAPYSSTLSLENSMDRGAWWAIVHEVSELDTTKLLTHTHTAETMYLWEAAPTSQGSDSTLFAFLVSEKWLYYKQNFLLTCECH